VSHTKFKPMLRSHVLVVAILSAAGILVTGYFQT